MKLTIWSRKCPWDFAYKIMSEKWIVNCIHLQILLILLHLWQKFALKNSGCETIRIQSNSFCPLSSSENSVKVFFSFVRDAQKNLPMSWTNAFHLHSDGARVLFPGREGPQVGVKSHHRNFKTSWNVRYNKINTCDIKISNSDIIVDI